MTSLTFMQAQIVTDGAKHQRSRPTAHGWRQSVMGRGLSRLFAIFLTILFVLSPVEALAQSTGCKCPNNAAVSASAADHASISAPSMPCCDHAKACATNCVSASPSIALLPASSVTVWIARQCAKLRPSAEQSPPSTAGDAEMRPPKSIA